MVKEYTGRGEALNKQGGRVWLGRGGVSSAMTMTLGELPEGARHQRP